jgi:hypothetical protein
MADAEVDPLVTYQFSMDREDWREWTDTLPRSIDIPDRLAELIRQDTVVPDDADIERASVDVIASRIRIRTMQAASALNEGDTDTVEAQLDDIAELADALES